MEKKTRYFIDERGNTSRLEKSVHPDVVAYYAEHNREITYKEYREHKAALDAMLYHTYNVTINPDADKLVKTFAKKFNCTPGQAIATIVYYHFDIFPKKSQARQEEDTAHED